MLLSEHKTNSLALSTQSSDLLKGPGCLRLTSAFISVLNILPPSPLFLHLIPLYNSRLNIFFCGNFSLWTPMVVLNKSMNTSKSLPFKSQCFLTLWPIENSGCDTMWLVNLGHKRPCISTLFTGILSLGLLLFHVRNLAILKPPWWKGYVQVYLGQYLQLSLTFQKFLPRQLQVNEAIWDPTS